MTKEQEFYGYKHQSKSEEKFVVDENVAEVIADRLIQENAMRKDNSRELTIKFPLPEEQWEAELALRSLDIALTLYDLSMQRSYHKHADSDEEYDFWERFSEEVTKVLEDKNLVELVIQRIV